MAAKEAEGKGRVAASAATVGGLAGVAGSGSGWAAAAASAGWAAEEEAG